MRPAGWRSLSPTEATTGGEATGLAWSPAALGVVSAPVLSTDRPASMPSAPDSLCDTATGLK
ncbi:hypothetical protein ACIU1J_30020 [Azospirillum doebereinerae]|uniref:hypothetical protein n=1 Tax=Azospirillum doebereinerae TaxID=92933 RepID=UPI00384E3E91